MFVRQKRSARIWKTKTSQNLTLDQIQDISQLSLLKSATKKAAIKTRLDNKQFNRDFLTNKNSTFSKDKISVAKNRPQTSKAQKTNSFDLVKRAYRIQQEANQKLLTQKQQNSKWMTQKSSCKNEQLKQGLLGQYQKYEKMNKRELIQKLISLEYLANNIFSKNKALQQKIRDLEKK